MEKRTYVKPVLSGEEFIPQNYIAACGDSGTIYKFHCDAGGGASGNVYIESNKIGGLQKPSCHCENDTHSSQYNCPTWGNGDDKSLGGYHACANPETGQGIHEASSTDDFLSGYYVNNAVTIPVIIWRGPKNDNVHCTTQLDMSNWETAKS